MIKINVITKNINWLKYIKNPSNYLERKINKLNSKDKKFKKKDILFIFLIFFIQLINISLNKVVWIFYITKPSFVIRDSINLYHQCFYFDKP